MTWLTYFLGAYWPIIAVTILFVGLIVLFTTDRRPRP